MSNAQPEMLVPEPIAIVGMASIFARAENLQQYWENILNKVDCISEVPESRWRLEDYYDPDPQAVDKTYCKRGGFIPKIPFDPMEFGLPPNILEVTDITQLLGLVVAKAALKDAGYEDAPATVRARTGVILGVVGGTMQLLVPLTTRLQSPVWRQVLTSSGLSDTDAEGIIEKLKLAYVGWEENAFPGWLGNVISGRIANRLDLGGINCVVDAACASSLSAVRMALAELAEHRSDLVITGGLDLDNSILMYMSFSKTPAFSKSQSIRPFAAAADGTLIGEGLGMVVLKRLADAQRDGDRIYALIRGIGASSDGRHKSIYAPNWQGQRQAIASAYDQAGCSPASVGLIEAHGTGTAAGDLSEFTALRAAFVEAGTPRQQIALGSVKSQIGHTKGAAGAAGLIKAALALHHKILPPTLNVDRPHPNLQIDESPFYLNTECRPWIRGAEPRRAGVSAFGFGGTNYHLVLEEYEGEHSAPYRLHASGQGVLLGAPTPDGLLAECEALLRQLRGADAVRVYSEMLESSKRTLPRSFARLGFLATDCEEVCASLAQAIEHLSSSQLDWEHPSGIYYRKEGMAVEGSLVALFPGQGSQYLQMGSELACNDPSVRECFAAIDALFRQEGLQTVSETVFPPPAFEETHRTRQVAALQSTEYAQPAIGTLSAALYTILRDAGFRPDFAIGHSFGELTALWAAGVLSDQDFMALTKARGKAMSIAPGSDAVPSGMLAVRGPLAQILPVVEKLAGVVIANWNSPQQLVLAGRSGALLDAQRLLEAGGCRTVMLPVATAFHTAAVGHALAPFARAMDAATVQAPSLSVYSNRTAEPYPEEPAAIRALLLEQIVHPVRFKEAIEQIYAQGGSCFVEFGPKGVLTGLVGEILAGRPHVCVALNPSSRGSSDRQLQAAVVQLRVLGLPLADACYRRPPEKSGAAPAMTIPLDGNGYVSEKTKTAFARALASGHRVQPPLNGNGHYRAVQSFPQPEPEPPAPHSLNGHKTQAQAGAHSPAPVSVVDSTTEGPAMSKHPAAYRQFFDSLANTLAQIGKQQGETLRVHSQYLNHQTEYSKIFFQLLQQQQGLLGHRGEGDPSIEAMVAPLLESLENGMTHLHRHEADTLHLHESYLQHQVVYSQACVQMLQQQLTLLAPHRPVATASLAVVAPTPLPVAVEPPPLPVHQKNGHAAEQHAPVPVAVAPPVQAAVEQALLQVVSQKTGYPSDLLTLDMDMEADLAIDSIKRIEILGALQEVLSDLTPVKPEELAELRTLGQICEHWASLAKKKPQPQLIASLPV